MHPVVKGNVQALQQLLSLLDTLRGDHYAVSASTASGSSMGRHLRHILDHYHAIADAVSQSGEVDYDRRQRDSHIERDIVAAKRALQQRLRWLRELAEEALARQVLVKTEVLLNEQHCVQMPSTLGRELLYASAHTVHHLAFMAATLKTANVPLSPTIGLAPATASWTRKKPLAKCDLGQ